MFYTDENFRTKKALKDAVASGRHVGVYAPGLGMPPANGRTCVGGPHYPEAHKWYAEVTLPDSIIVTVK